MAYYRNGRWISEAEATEALKATETEENTNTDDTTGEVQPEGTKEDVAEAEPKTAEEQTWKKRYGDLRRLTNDLQAKVKELEARQAATPTEAAPVSKEDVEEWLRQNPEMVSIVKGIVSSQVQTPVADLDSRLRQVEERERNVRFEEAKKQVFAKHPDFSKLAGTAEFAEWLKEKPEWVRDALYAEDNIDVKAAIQAIDWYKAEQIAKRKPKAEDASKAITRKGATEVSAAPEKRIWTTEEIRKLSSKDFEKYEADITAARREGRVQFGASGAAR